jgi:hypothetical protein
MTSLFRVTELGGGSLRSLALVVVRRRDSDTLERSSASGWASVTLATTLCVLGSGTSGAGAGAAARDGRGSRGRSASG